MSQFWDDEEAEKLRQIHRDEQAAQKKTLLLTKSGTDFVIRPIGWHWRGWLAYGKLHLIAGGKATGKSTICFDLMARTSVGGQMPDGETVPSGDVIIWSSEDDIEDTILPRFVAAGGDLKRIFPIQNVLTSNDQLIPFDPSTHLDALATLMGKISCRLLVIDPIVLILPDGSDSHKNSETRRGLQPLISLLSNSGAVGLGVTHFSKGSDDQNPVDRVTGSLAFGALARVVFGTEHDQENDTRRFIRIASNIGPSGGGFEYSMLQMKLANHDGIWAQRVEWGDALDGPAATLLHSEKETKLEQAQNFLKEILASGPMPQTEVRAAMYAKTNISWATVRRAHEKLGVVARKDGAKWLWELPAPIKGGQWYN